MKSVHAHYDGKIYREYASKLGLIAKAYWWEDIKADTKELIPPCIHCTISHNGKRITRPISTASHGEGPNGSACGFHIYSTRRKSSLKNVLKNKDDISSYTRLYPSDNMDSDIATAAKGQWITCSGEMNWLVTELDSHSKSWLVGNLISQMHIKHHFTTAYCPWSNGMVEHVYEEVLGNARLLLSEWRMLLVQWPTIFDVIQ